MIMRILLTLLIGGMMTIGIISCSVATHSNVLAPTAIPSLAPPLLQAPHVGKLAPDFALDTLDGSRKVHLNDFHDKAVLLIFWASICSACVKELPVVQKFSVQQKAAGKQIAVLAVDIDMVSDFVNVSTLQERFGLTYPILVDDHFQARSSYQVTNVPIAYFIDRQRIIRAIVPGSLNDTSLRSRAESLEGP